MSIKETSKIIDSDFESALATAHYIALCSDAKFKIDVEFWDKI